MELKLKITNGQENADKFGDFCVFDSSGGTVGRGQGADWTLSDPERTISGYHAKTYFENGSFYLEDTSSNGTFLKNTNSAIGKGNSIKLHNGVCFLIGDYEITTEVLEEPSYIQQKSSNDSDVETSNASSFSGSQNNQMIGDDFDSFLEVNSNDPKNQVLTESNHIPATQENFNPPGALSSVIPDDWDNDSVELQQETNVKEDEVLDLSKNHDKLKQEQSQVGSFHDSSKSINSEENISPAGQELLSAFFKGAGIDEVDFNGQSSTEYMNLMGQLLRELVQGLMQVLMARGALKSEFRIPVTTLQQIENNPLKFAMGVDEALSYMLIKEGQGYMPPMEATHEGFEDLKDHQIAIMSGTQAAFQELLKKFDPEAIEIDFARSQNSALGAVSKVFKFREWYKDYYKHLTKDPEYTFQKLFGETFVRAYEEQIEQLSYKRKPQDKG